MRDLFLFNDYAIAYSTVDRVTGFAFSDLQLTASLSLTPYGPPLASASVTLSTILVEDPPCSGEYVGGFSAEKLLVVSESMFGVSGTFPGAQAVWGAVYENITSGSNLQVSTPLVVRSARVNP